MSQLIRFARVCSHVDDVKARNKRLMFNKLTYQTGMSVS